MSTALSLIVLVLIVYGLCGLGLWWQGRADRNWPTAENGSRKW